MKYIIFPIANILTLLGAIAFDITRYLVLVLYNFKLPDERYCMTSKGVIGNYISEVLSNTFIIQSFRELFTNFYKF